MGWTFPWASSFDGDFNFDFDVSFTREQQRGEEGGIEYNYRQEPPWRGDERIITRMSGDPVGDNAFMTGTDPATYTRERPGMSAFALGIDALLGMYQWLDRAPKGRNETGMWWRRHDEYDTRAPRTQKPPKKKR